MSCAPWKFFNIASVSTNFMSVFVKAWRRLWYVFCLLNEWALDEVHRLAGTPTQPHVKCLQLMLQAAPTMCLDQGDSVVAVSSSLLDGAPNMDLRHAGFWYPTTKRMNQDAKRSQSGAGQQANCSLRAWLRCCGLLRCLLDDLAGVERCKARVVIVFFWRRFFSFSSSPFFFAKFNSVHQGSLTVC